MENVPQVIGANNIKDFQKWEAKLSSLGYQNYIEILNAKDYGIPQNRQRCFMVSVLGDYSYEFPIRLRLEKRLKDLLEDNVDEKYFLSDKMLEKISNWKGYENPLDDIDPNRVCSCITTHCGKDSNSMQLVKSLPIKNATKKGYLEAEEGDGIDISTRMDKHRGTVQKGTSQTLTCAGGNNVGVVVKEKRGNVFHLYKNTKHLKETIENNEFEKGEPLNLDLYNRTTYKESQTLCDPRHNSQRLFDGLRIRKLTPKECMRLMGFEDSDYEAMKQAGLSDSAIYHCASDSIVSTVLVAIFSQLFDNKNKHIKVIKEYLNHRFNKK